MSPRARLPTPPTPFVSSPDHPQAQARLQEQLSQRVETVEAEVDAFKSLCQQIARTAWPTAHQKFYDSHPQKIGTLTAAAWLAFFTQAMHQQAPRTASGPAGPAGAPAGPPQPSPAEWEAAKAEAKLAEEAKLAADAERTQALAQQTQVPTVGGPSFAGAGPGRARADMRRRPAVPARSDYDLHQRKEFRDICVAVLEQFNPVTEAQLSELIQISCNHPRYQRAGPQLTEMLESMRQEGVYSLAQTPAGKQITRGAGHRDTQQLHADALAERWPERTEHNNLALEFYARNPTLEFGGPAPLSAQSTAVSLHDSNAVGHVIAVYRVIEPGLSTPEQAGPLRKALTSLGHNGGPADLHLVVWAESQLETVRAARPDPPRAYRVHILETNRGEEWGDMIEDKLLRNTSLLRNT